MQASSASFLSVVGADRARFIPHAKVEAHIEASGVRSWTFLRAGFFAQNLLDSYRPDIIENDRIHVAAGRGRAAFVDAPTSPRSRGSRSSAMPASIAQHRS